MFHNALAQLRRVLPADELSFDPAVLAAFVETAPLLAEIFEQHQ